MKKPIFLMLTAMLLCSAYPNQIFSQNETPELREIFKDSVLTRRILEEVGFYQPKKTIKAWRLAYQWPEKIEHGLWRYDSAQVAQDMVWVNDSTSFLAWTEDTVLFSEYKETIEQPDSTSWKVNEIIKNIESQKEDTFLNIIPVFELKIQSIFDLVLEKYSESTSYDTMSFYLDAIDLSLTVQAINFIGTYDGWWIYKAQESQRDPLGEWTYAMRRMDKKHKHIYYHFFNEDHDWVNGFDVNFKDVHVWNVPHLKSKKIKKIFAYLKK